MEIKAPEPNQKYCSCVFLKKIGYPQKSIKCNCKNNNIKNNNKKYNNVSNN
jgi:hypothetical protein